jgi:hypothetical protein
MSEIPIEFHTFAGNALCGACIWHSEYYLLAIDNHRGPQHTKVELNFLHVRWLGSILSRPFSSWMSTGFHP